MILNRQINQYPLFFSTQSSNRGVYLSDDNPLNVLLLILYQMDTRLIPNNLGGSDILQDGLPGVGSVETNDAIYAFGPGLITLLASEQIIPAEYSNVSLILSVAAFLLGGSLLILKPDYMTLSAWFKTLREYRKMNKNIILNLTEKDGELVNSDEDTREEVGVERIYPSENVLETTDEQVVGMVKMKGLNLYNAPESEIKRSIGAYTGFLNSQVSEDFQLYLPMRRFDPTSKINHLKERLDEEEVSSDEFLRTYAQDRMLWLEMTAQQSYTRDYYAVLKTTKEEVVTEEVGGESNVVQVLESLGDFGSSLTKVWLGISSSVTNTITPAEVRQQQLEEQQRKMSEFSDDIERALGTNAEVVSGNELGIILKEFWEGIEIKDNQKEGFVRKDKYVRGRTDREKGEEVYEDWANENDVNTGERL